MLFKCSDETGITFSLPLTCTDILSFTAWLLSRDVRSSTISSYLSGLRQMHLSNGLIIPEIRSDIVNQVLRGKANFDAVHPTNKPPRLPITPTALRLLKYEISVCLKPKYEKRLLWFLCTALFHGSFRLGELLSKTKTYYDPDFCLLRQDLTIGDHTLNNSRFSVLSFSIKSPKANKPNTPDIVDIFPTNTDLCPVKAYLNWTRCDSRSAQDLPLFSLLSGSPITCTDFNSLLKLWLSKYFDPAVGYFSGHSFRAGIPSILGNLGFNDSDIKLAGRWSSSAFQAYLKLPRTRRLAMAEAIGGLSL